MIDLLIKYIFCRYALELRIAKDTILYCDTCFTAQVCNHTYLTLSLQGASDLRKFFFMLLNQLQLFPCALRKKLWDFIDYSDLRDYKKIYWIPTSDKPSLRYRESWCLTKKGSDRFFRYKQNTNSKPEAEFK